CDAIKQTESIKHIPVIVMSTYPQLKVANLKCADEVIQKPFDISFLIHTINDHLPFSNNSVHSLSTK
ncbi:MAG: hypothetical protein ABIN95_09520, partial [Mucilaginibacter sp.]